MNSTKRSTRRGAEADEVLKLLNGGKKLPKKHVDYYISTLEAGSPVTSAELGLAISFQAIALGLLAVMWSVPESALFVRICVGVAALATIIVGFVMGAMCLHSTYKQRDALRALYAAKRDAD